MFHNRIILAALVLFFLGSMFLVVTYFLKPTYQEVVVGNQNTSRQGGGTLPEIGGGFNANIAGGVGGSLPNVNIVGRVVEGGAGSDVANGGKTRADEVVSGRVADIRVGGSGQLELYDASDGVFYHLTSSGQKIKLSDEEFPNAESVTWSPDDRKAIIEFPDGTAVLKDFSRNTRITLPREGQDFVFQDDSEHVVFNYVTQDPDRNFLVVGDPAGADVKAVEPIGDRFERVQPTYSPDGSIVAFYRKAHGAASEEIVFIGQQQEVFKSLVVNGIDFRGMWLPEGDRLLYSVISPDNGYNPTLWVVDAHGESIGLNNTQLGISATADSCAISESGQIAYCPVPKELQNGAGLDPALFANQESTIYEVNLANGYTRMIADPVSDDGSRGVVVQDLQVSADGGALYFIDGRTSKVLKVKLK